MKDSARVCLIMALNHFLEAREIVDSPGEPARRVTHRFRIALQGAPGNFRLLANEREFGESGAGGSQVCRKYSKS